MFSTFSKIILTISALISFNSLAEEVKVGQFSLAVLDSNKNFILKYEGVPRIFKMQDFEGKTIYLDFFQINQKNTKEKALAVFLSQDKETEKFYFSDTSKTMEGYLGERNLQVLINKLN